MLLSYTFFTSSLVEIRVYIQATLKTTTRCSAVDQSTPRIASAREGDESLFPTTIRQPSHQAAFATLGHGRQHRRN